MEGKESPSTGLENLSREELNKRMDEADKLGHSDGIAQGLIYQEIVKRSQSEEQLTPVSQKPVRVKKVKPIKGRGIHSPIDGSVGMRGIGKNRGNR